VLDQAGGIAALLIGGEKEVGLPGCCDGGLAQADPNEILAVVEQRRVGM
jgi:hypothetical protein